MSRTLFVRRLGVILLAPLLAAALWGCGGKKEFQSAQSVATLAGAPGGAGYFDGSGASDRALIRFSAPAGATVSATGDIFVADTANHVIRRVDAAGNVSTFAGSAGVPGAADDPAGNGSAARFNSPAGIVAVGTVLFVSDTGNHTIRRIAASGAVTTLAGSAGNVGSADDGTTGVLARFNGPRGIATDGAASLFVADTGNHTIRKVTLSGATATYAGTAGLSGTVDNTGLGARFASPEGVAFLGGDVFVADTGNHTIRRITPAGPVGSVTTVAGSAGTAGFADSPAGTSARFNAPASLVAIGSLLFVVDRGNHIVRQVAAAEPFVVSTLAGSPGVAGFADGAGTSALFDGPDGIGTDGVFLVVADTGNHAVRTVTAAGSAATAAGNAPRAGVLDGTGAAARFDGPWGVAAIGTDVFVADNVGNAIRKVADDGSVTTLVGPGTFLNPSGIVAIGTDLFVCDSGHHVIRRVTTSGTVTVTLVAGTPDSAGVSDGPGTSALFRNPQGIAAVNGDLFVADAGNHTIRKVVASGDFTVSTVAGTAGTPGSTDNTTLGTGARFNRPSGVAATSVVLGGRNLFVTDAGNHAVRKVTIASTNSTFPVSTVAGSAGTAGFADGSRTGALFNSPQGIAAAGGDLFVADTGNHVVRRVTTAGDVTTVVGNPGAATTRDGDASSALLNAPSGIAAGTDSTLFFTDSSENVVRKILF